MQEKQYTEQSHSYPHENEIDYDALPDIAGADGHIPRLLILTAVDCALDGSVLECHVWTSTLPYHELWPKNDWYIDRVYRGIEDPFGVLPSAHAIRAIPILPDIISPDYHQDYHDSLKKQ